MRKERKKQLSYPSPAPWNNPSVELSQQAMEDAKQTFMQRQREVERAEAELKALEEKGYVYRWRRPGYGDRGPEQSVLFRPGSIPWRKQYQAKYQAYSDLYGQYERSHARYETAKRQVYQGLQQKHEQIVARENLQLSQQAMIQDPNIMAQSTITPSTRPLQESVIQEGRYAGLTVSEAAALRDTETRSIGEQKAWEAFYKLPEWTRTTATGELYLKGIESWKSEPALVAAGWLSPWESLIRPEVPTFSGALLSNIPASIRTRDITEKTFWSPARIHSGIRKEVWIDPKKGQMMKEWESLDPVYQFSSVASEVAQTLLFVKAASWTGEKIVSRLPKSIQNLFIDQKSVTETKIYRKGVFDRKTVLPRTETRYMPVKKAVVKGPSLQEEQIARKALGWVSEQKYRAPDITQTSLNKTFGAGGQMLEQLVERPVKVIQTLKLQTKMAAKTKQISQAATQTVRTKTVSVPVQVTRTVTKKSVAAKVAPYVVSAGMFMANPPKPPRLAAPPKYELSEWGKPKLAPYPVSRNLLDQSSLSRVRQKTKQVQRLRQPVVQESILRPRTTSGLDTPSLVIPDFPFPIARLVMSPPQTSRPPVYPLPTTDIPRKPKAKPFLDPMFDFDTPRIKRRRGRRKVGWQLIDWKVPTVKQVLGVKRRR